MWIVARRASSEFSRGVERSETPGNRCKDRCFRRNHLGARLMVPCRETIWGSPQSGGIAALNPRLSSDFSLRENSCQRTVVSFQFLDFRCQRVAVRAPGRAHAGQGRLCCPQGNDFAPRGSVGEPPDAARAPFRTPLLLRGFLLDGADAPGSIPTLGQTPKTSIAAVLCI